MNERFEITQDMTGVVTIRETAEFGGSPNHGYGVSRPRFEAVLSDCYDAVSKQTVRGWKVDLGDGDNAWSFDNEADAVHAAGVLQGVMDRHLAAAREEGRREALRVAGLIGYETERVRPVEGVRRG